jgi:hypothetical protein
MKKLTILLSAAVLSVSAVFGQQDATQSTNQSADSTYALATASVGMVSNISGLRSFRSISVSGKIEIFVTVEPSQHQSMTVEYNGNAQDSFKWSDEDDTLDLKFSSKPKDRPIVVRLTCTQLSAIDLRGASMTTVTPWSTKMATIDMTANSKLTATIEASDIQISASIKSTAVIDGKSVYTDIDARTRSVIDASNLDSRSATLRASGYAECRLYGAERIVVEAFDSASVFWRGNPDILRLHRSRGATINPIGE